MTVDYYSKYLKYKSKYLKLKAQLGSGKKMYIESNCKTINEKCTDVNKCNKGTEQIEGKPILCFKFEKQGMCINKKCNKYEYEHPTRNCKKFKQNELCETCSKPFGEHYYEVETCDALYA
jgi:hypothetical protein